MSNNVKNINMFVGVADINNRVLATVNSQGLQVQQAGSSIISGRVIIALHGTPQLLSDTSIPIKRVKIKAEAGNTANVYVGDSSMKYYDGYNLAASGELELFISNLNLIYLDTDTDGNAIRYIAEA